MIFSLCFPGNEQMNYPGYNLALTHDPSAG